MKSFSKKMSSVLLSSMLLGVPVLSSAADSEHSFSGNIALTSNYVFRGVSQSQNQPALQGGVDYAHKSGVYAGTWASNVAWVNDSALKKNSSLEIDLYAGYKGSLLDGLSYDLGALYYEYPGKLIDGATEPNSAEVYAALSWNNISLKYSHAVSKNLFAWGNNEIKTRGSNYTDLSYEYALNDKFSLQAHLGKQNIRHLTQASYRDWKIGASYALAAGKISAAYTDTNADEGAYTWNEEKVAKGLFAVTYSYSF